MEPIIKLQNVSVVYHPGKTNEMRASRDVSLEIFPQEYIIFFGPSGSGKSTLLNLIAGLEKPTEGKVMIQGKDISLFDEESLMEFHRSTIGIIFQAFYLISNLNTRDNILLPQIFKESPMEERSTRLKKLAERFEIVPFLNKRGGELSGGQQQRVAAARALINDPHIILADEPVGNLDTKNAEITMQLLKELNEKDQKTVILVTHDPRYLPFAHRVFYIKDGQLVKTTRNVSKIAGFANARTVTELEKIAELFPYLDEDKLIPKLILNQCLVPFSIEEQGKVEELVGMYIAKKITAEELKQKFDLPTEQGGLAMYSQTAKHLADKIAHLTAEMSVVSGGANVAERTVPEKVASLHGYLLEQFSGTLTPEQLHRLDEAIEKRLSGIYTSAGFLKQIDLSFKEGGVGLNSRTAHNFAHEIELVLAGKIQ